MQQGCELFHATSDPDHNRTVVTVAGSPRAVRSGAVAAAAIALREIDMRRHRGVHPRVGAIDVLPFVPLHGISMDEVVALAHQTGERIAALGLPVYFYRNASVPPGRPLASIRRGGFEALAAIEASGPGKSAAAATSNRVGHPSGGGRQPEDPRAPADLSGQRSGDGQRYRFAHPAAGAVCITARPVLLAWNVYLKGVSLAFARSIAARIRETGGGFDGLRAIAARLPRQQSLQISMNLEDLSATDPLDVFRTIQSHVTAEGGKVCETEVVGMIPEPLSAPATARAMAIRDWSPERFLDRRLSSYLAARDPRRRKTPARP